MLKEVKPINKVLAVSNYDDAVHILGKEQPGIVLLEIHLPGKNGIELLKFIVKNYPGVKVIMLTNLVSEYYQRLCKETGAAGFIDKSKDFDLIPEMIGSLLAGT